MFADALMAALPELRRHAEALMLDEGTAGRPTGGYVYNSAAQGEVLATSNLFTSACKIQASDRIGSREAEVGGRTATTVRLELHLPVTTDALQVGDLFTITATHELSLATIGTQYRVLAPVDGTLKTARRYEVERA